MAKANFKDTKGLSAVDFNRWQMARRRVELSKVIPTDAARLYFEVQKSGKLPDWVATMTDERDMRLLAS